MAEINVII